MERQGLSEKDAYQRIQRLMCEVAEAILRQVCD
jgi:hypothetical protein